MKVQFNIRIEENLLKRVKSAAIRQGAAENRRISDSEYISGLLDAHTPKEPRSALSAPPPEEKEREEFDIEKYIEDTKEWGE